MVGKLFKKYNEFYFQEIIEETNELGFTASTQDGEFDYKLDRQNCIQLIGNEEEINVSVLFDICGNLVYEVPEIIIDENNCIILSKI